MSYVACTACPNRGQCLEEGMCLNTLVTHRYGAARPVDAPYAAERAALGLPPTPVPKAAPAPGPKPASGSVTEQIFSVCDEVLAQMWPEGSAALPVEQRLAAARKRAIAVLEAQGVNINSARKGSSMWLQSRR